MLPPNGADAASGRQRHAPYAAKAAFDALSAPNAAFATAGAAPQRWRYSRSNPREMIVFWISDVPSPMSRNGASRMRRSISYSLE